MENTTLKLQRIYLQNWKCYQNQTVDFDLNTDKNVWIIFGQNGYGKSSIQEAILWCLYGHKGVKTNELPEYFNRITVKRDPNLEISVRLDFQQNDCIYSVSRVARRIKKGTTVSADVEEPLFYCNGKIQTDSRERIEGILPRSCKEFFFFDGQKIEDYAKFEHTKETRDAIERILGIPEIRNLRDDTNGALREIQKKLNEASSANNQFKDVTSRLINLQHSIEVKSGQLKIAIQEKQQEEKILQGVEERARQIDELRSKLDKLTELQLKQSQLQNYFKDAEEAVEQALRETPISLLLKFVKEVADDLQSKTMVTKIVSVSAAQLRKILDANSCVCGRGIDEDARNYILQQLESIDAKGTTEEILRQVTLRTRLMMLSRYQTPDFDEVLLKRDRILEELDEVKQTISRLHQETEGVNHKEAQEILKQVGHEERLVQEKEEKIERLQKEVQQLKQQEDQLQRERENLAGQSQETAMLNKQYRLAEGLYQAANELIEWQIEDHQRTIEDYTSQLHHHVTNKPDEYIGIQIKSDYTLELKNVAGTPLNPETLSAGEKEALAFAFIAGLNLASGTAAPLMMDTPFGNLDDTHQKNIINSLPTIPSQVILLATDRDLPEDLLRKLRPHVVQIHRIRRLGATEDASVIETEE